MFTLLAILTLGFCIFFHEMGHFLVAKASKVPVSEFAVGMGPALVKKEIRGTTYALRVLPFGGYVAFEDEESYKNTAPRFRAAILIAGPLFNVILAYICFVIVLTILSGDLWLGITRAPEVMWEMVKLLINGLQRLFTGQIPLTDLSGPVGIVKETHHVYSGLGIEKSLQWIGLLNLNLAIMNLIPIPGLDGGRLLLIGLEKLRIKLSPKVETIVILAGMFVILAFMLTGTWNDIVSFF